MIKLKDLLNEGNIQSSELKMVKKLITKLIGQEVHEDELDNDMHWFGVDDYKYVISLADGSEWDKKYAYSLTDTKSYKMIGGDAVDDFKEVLKGITSLVRKNANKMKETA